MPQLLLALALISTDALTTTTTPPRPPITSPTAAVELDDPIAEMLGKAVVVWCRPSSLEHGITMLERRWSIDGEFRSLTARFRWYGFWAETSFKFTVRIEAFTGGEALKVSSIEYGDDCLTPCEMCKKLGEAREVLNRKLREALD